MFRRRVSLAPANYKWDLNRIINAANHQGDLEILETVLSLVPDGWNWNRIILNIMKFGYPQSLQRALSVAPSDYKWDSKRIINEAKKLNNQEITDIVYEYFSYQPRWMSSVTIM